MPGAATVEFLYIMETQEYCFLELNPRLQVGARWLGAGRVGAGKVGAGGCGGRLHSVPHLQPGAQCTAVERATRLMGRSLAALRGLTTGAVALTGDRAGSLVVLQLFLMTLCQMCEKMHRWSTR